MNIRKSPSHKSKNPNRTPTPKKGYMQKKIAKHMKQISTIPRKRGK